VQGFDVKRLNDVSVNQCIQLNHFKDIVIKEQPRNIDSLGVSFQQSKLPGKLEKKSNSTPLAMGKIQTQVNINSDGMMLPENIAFLIANAVKKQLKPNEITNINNNINIYGQIAISPRPAHPLHSFAPTSPAKSNKTGIGSGIKNLSKFEEARSKV
jgi:hypothetical protein